MGVDSHLVGGGFGASNDALALGVDPPVVVAGCSRTPKRRRANRGAYSHADPYSKD